MVPMPFFIFFYLYFLNELFFIIDAMEMVANCFRKS